jgi:hypothetical protein
MFEEIHIGHLAIMLETCENHLCGIMKYVFWMLEVNFSFDSRAIAERCHREIENNFLGSLRNHLELVMHVWSILEMTGCCLHLLENFYMHNKPLTDLFKNEKSPRTSLSSLIFPNKDTVVFHCKKLLLLQLSLGNHNHTYLFGALHYSPYLENPTNFSL